MARIVGDPVEESFIGLVANVSEGLSALVMIH